MMIFHINTSPYSATVEIPTFESDVLFITHDSPNVNAGRFLNNGKFACILSNERLGIGPTIFEVEISKVKEWWFANNSRPIPNEDIKKPEDSAKRSLILADISRLVNELKDLK